VTQRLQRIGAVRAIHGARGAIHLNNIVRSSIYFAAGTRTGRTQALNARDLRRPVLPQTRFTAGDSLSQGGQNLNFVQYLRNLSTYIFGKTQIVSRLAGFGMKRAPKNALIDPFGWQIA